MLTALTGCDGNKWRSAEGAVWATSYHITYHGPKELHDSIIAVMKDVEMSLSPFNEASAISRLNRGETDSVDAMFGFSSWRSRCAGQAGDCMIPRWLRW